MVWLYGNRRRLFGRWQVLMAAYHHTLFPMFAIQVCIGPLACSPAVRLQ